MMVIIVRSRNLFYFVEAQIVLISMFKRKNYINKCLTKLNNVTLR